VQITVPIALWAAVPLASAAIAAGAALFAQHMANNRDKNQRDHERKLREMELEEAKQQRLRDDRIRVYTDLSKQISGKESIDQTTFRKLWETYAEIRILAGSQDVAAAAMHLYTAARKFKEVRDNHEAYDNKEFNETINDLMKAHLEFMKEARADIGHPPEAHEMRL